MYIIDFEYANRRVSDLGYVVCRIDSGVGINEVNIGCDLTFNTVKNNQSSVHSVTSSSYENVYITTFDIAKNSCSANGDDIYINPYEVRELLKWLNRRGHYKFKPYDLDNSLEDICYYGSCNAHPLAFGAEIVGLRVTFTSNAPYAFAETLESQGMLLNKKDEFCVYGDSDEYGIIYPKVNIHCFEDGYLKITNHLTKTETEIANCINGETITLDGTYKIIDTDNEQHKDTLGSDFNYSYLDIVVDEECSENVYSSTLPCEITVSYSPIRKVGVY